MKMTDEFARRWIRDAAAGTDANEVASVRLAELNERAESRLAQIEDVREWDESSLPRPMQRAHAPEPGTVSRVGWCTVRASWIRERGTPCAPKSWAPSWLDTFRKTPAE